MRYQTKSTCLISVFAILLLCCYTSPLFAQTELLPTSDFKNDTQSTLTIAMSEDLLPLSFFNADGRPAGLFVDIWRLWAEKTGRKIAFRLTSWAETMKALKLGEVDIHSGLFEAENRAAWIRFSQPIYGVGIRIFFPLKRGNILTLRELAGKKVGVTRGSHTEGYVRERYPEFEVVAFRSMKEAIYAAREGTIAAFVGVDPVISGILVRLGLQGEFENIPEALYKRTFHAGVLKENVELLNVIDKGFDAISTSEVAKIEARWIPDPKKQYFKSGEKKLRLTPEERAWLVKHPKIDVGIMNNWPPMNYVDEKGIPRGIGVDYLDAINARLGDVLNIISAPFKENYDAVQAKRLDALMDITPKPDREPFFNFTKPYLTIPQIIVGQKNTPYLNGEKDLYGKTVALERGYYTITRFKRDHPEIKIREYNSTSDCLDALARGEVDAYVGNRAVAIYLIEKELIANLQTMGRTSEKPVPLVIGTRKDFPELAVILDKALASLSPQEIQDIHRKWTKSTDAIAKAIELTPEEKAWLVEHPVITLATLPNWAPFIFLDESTNEPRGYDIDYMALLNKKLGGAIKLELYDWATAVQMGKDHKVDGFFPAAIFDDRKPYLVWSDIYRSYPLSLVGQRDAPGIEAWSELAGKKVAMTAGSTYIELIGQLAPESELIIVNTVREQLQILLEGKADAALNAAPVIYHQMRAHNLIQQLKFLKVYYSPNHGQGRIAIRNDAPLLLSIINKGIASITDEEINALKSKWLPAVTATRESETPAIDLTKEEKAWIKANPVIRLSHNNTINPMSFIGKGGEIKGVMVDYVRLLEQKLGLKIELVGSDWPTALDRALKYEVDGILNAAALENRKRYLDFTEVYFRYPMVVIAQKDKPMTTGLAALSGQKVGVIKNSSYGNYLRVHFPSIKLVEFNNEEDSLRALATGDLNAAFGNYAYLVTRLKELRLIDFKVVYYRYIPPAGFSRIGIRKDKPLLHSLLNKAIASIQDEQHNLIATKWFGNPLPSLPEHILQPKKIGLNEKERDWIKAHPKITLGADSDWRPYVIPNKDGSVSGIEPDFFRKINELTGLNLQIKLGKWSEIVEEAKSREIDGLAVSARHPERAEHFLFSDSPYSSYKYIYTKSDGLIPKSMDDLKGKKVAYQRGNMFDEKLLKKYPAITLVPSSGSEETMSLLLSGEVDAAISGITLRLFYSERMMSGVEMAFIAPKSELKLLYSLRKDWPELQSIINKALAAIPLGERLAILEKWGLSELKMAEVSSIRDKLTDEERDWLDAHPAIPMCVDPAWMPFEQINKKGKYEGMVADYMALISERIGAPFRLQPTETYSESLAKVSAGECLLVSSWGPGAGGDDPGLSTGSYLTLLDVLAVRMDTPFISEHDDLAGLRIGAVVDYPTQGKIRKLYPQAELMLVDNVDEGVRKVSSGEIDAVVASQSAIGYSIQKQHLTNVKLGGVIPGDEHVRMMVNRNEPLLVAILDKAIASITREDRKQIADKWFTVRFERGFDYGLMWKILAVVGLVLALFLYWNRRMAKEVRNRKLAEQFARDARHTAEAASLAKSTFLANMSHELRTPMNAILGFARLLSRDTGLAPEYQEKVNIINRSGQHLLSMINDVLDLSKIEAGRAELQEDHFDLVALIEEISVMIRSRATEKGLSVVVETETVRFPSAKADVGKLGQILINLLGNAVKFTDEGGVTIRCATIPIPEEPTRCHLVIEVEDTGPGIDPVRQAKIFEPFVQGIDMPVRKGTGLGLSICKAYADLMGGTLEVESELGKGSLFRVRLPAEIVEAADIKSPLDDKPRVIGLAPTDKTWRILVADDNRENLLLLKSLLEEVGFVVLEAENGQEALAAFKKESPDLIWMDMRMPVMDGYEAARQIRQCSGGDTVPIIAVTASAFSEQRHEILAAGCDDMVIKPFQAHEIFETMGRQLSVKYIYQDWDAEAAQMQGINLTAEMLAELPPELLQELRDSTLTLDREAIFAVIERIEPLAPDTAKGLRILMDNFQTGLIGELLGENDEK